MAETLRRIATRIIRQDEKGIHKEWYHSGRGDLLVRRDRTPAGDIVGFELDFEESGASAQPHVMWVRGQAVRTGTVDTGEKGGDFKASPVVTFHPSPDPEVLCAAATFVSDRRRRLPPAVRAFVLEKLGTLPPA